MAQKTKTDRELSLVADEFLWDTEDDPEVHAYVTNAIVALLKDHAAKKVLDLGCGNGVFTDVLARHEFDVVGMDFSKSGIEIAQRKFPALSFLQHDVSDSLPLAHQGQYDAVVAVEVVEHLLLPRRLIENALEALKPNGLLIITTPFHGYWKNLALALTNKFDDHWHPLRDYGHIKFFSQATITQLLNESGFTKIKFQGVGRISIFARSMIVSGVTSDLSPHTHEE